MTMIIMIMTTMMMTMTTARCYQETDATMLLMMIDG